MKFLEYIFSRDRTVKELLAAVAEEKGVTVSGTADIHKALLAAAVYKKSGRRVLLITPDEATASRLKGDISAFGVKAALFPARDFCFAEVGAASKEYEYKRIDTLSKLLDGQIGVVIASAEAAVQYTVPPEKLKGNMLTLKSGEEFSPESITERLLTAGYRSVAEVEGKGQFSRRGGILDIFPVNTASPVRIEFWGDEIDSISEFDIFDQRRTGALDGISVTQAGEVVVDNDELAGKLTNVMLSGKKGVDTVRVSRDIEALNAGISFCLDRYLPLAYREATLFDYMENAVVLVCEQSDILVALEGFYKRLSEDIRLYTEGGFLLPDSSFTLDSTEYERRVERAVCLENFTHYQSVSRVISCDYRRLPPWRGDMSVLLEDIEPYIKSGSRCVILAGGEKAAKLVARSTEEAGVKTTLDLKCSLDTLPEGVTVMGGGLSSGFTAVDGGVCCFTVAHLHSEDKPRKIKKNENAIGSLDELKTGDYVVHSIHGIGVFAGINKINNKGVIKDYIKINYAKTDVLYVPVTQLDLISKYIGSAESGSVRLNKLGSQEWQKTRARVKKAVREMAKELTALYAKRMSVKGYAFSPDTDLQRDFEARFPYPETEDQMRSAKEIKADMERAVPMDRLLCGDVGFGKTEVALRAAFKCVSEGKQCAVLVPTTILAFQHYNTVLRRLGDMPIKVAMLSRFVSVKEQNKIIKELKSGKIDLIIGTHRLISDDVEFRDLGLAIIDEEQRFGVAQKEKLKTRYPEVDVLTLSATPIPRTLNMAMSGLRDMSTIEEAPGERLPVQTYVTEYNNAVIIDALRRELRRSGQAYYLYNRTEDIERKASVLAEALPEARVAVAHGKMSEEELSRVWQRLLDHEIDILVCTTIIETGVDVPNANTLIIEQADMLGLSQLHQLRGRVGRSARRAFAYFCFRPHKELTEIAEKRLEAIREFTEFGAGFKIALRDLELRGAGNILGGEQHGHLEAVGYDMYIKLLNEAVCEENGIKPVEKAECTVDLNISAHIPERYIESLPARLGIYKRIAAIENEAQKSDVLDELIDRFGEPPRAVLGLIDIALLRRRAAALGIYEITEQGNSLILRVKEVNEEQIAHLMPAFGKRIALRADEQPYYEIKMVAGTPREKTIAEIASYL